MAFPTTPLNVHVEALIGTSGTTWVDLVALGKVRGNEDITITRGRADERGSASAGSCRFRVDNRSGDFADDNPTGTYYGYLTPNTRCRVWVEGEFSAPTAGTPTTATSSSTSFTISSPTVSAGTWIVLIQTTSASVRTDVSDPTGFTLIDYRIDSFGLLVMVWVKRSDGTEPSTYTLTQASGSATATAIPINGADDAVPELKWLLTTAPGATVTVPSSNPRAENDLALVFAAGRRSAGASYTWTAPGGYTEIVDHQQSTATTETLAKKALSSHSATGTVTFTPSASTLDSAIAFALTFAAAGAVRFDGEIPEWPPGADITSTDFWIDIVAAGRLRRLTQGARTLSSAMQRAATSATVAAPVAYWPGEDESGSSWIASGLSDGTPMQYSGTINFSNRQIFNGSGQVLAMTTGAYLRGVVPTHTGTGTIAYKGLFYIPTGIATSATLVDVYQTDGSNSIAIWSFQHNTGGNLRLLGLQNGGSVVVDSGAIATDIRDKDQLIGFTLVQSGSNVAWTVIQRYFVGGLLTQNTYTGTFASITLGRSTTLYVGTSKNVDQVANGHHMLGTDARMGEDFTSRGTGAPIALNGWGNEKAGRRIARLCFEEGIPLTMWGDPDDTMKMTTQDPGKLRDLLEDAVDMDGGILTETRGGFGLTYRTLRSLCNQTAVSVSYSSDYLSDELRSTRDDQSLWNDVTVTRDGGSRWRAVQKTGSRNVNEPEDDPDGVGTYDRGPKSMQAEADYQLPLIAGWLRHLGTWPDRRFPYISVNFARSVWVSNASLRKSVEKLIPGDRLALTGLPTRLSTEAPDCLIQGITEKITNSGQSRSWEVAFNTSPYGGYVVTDVGSASTQRAQIDSAQLAAAVNSSATTMLFQNTGVGRWSEANEPYDVMISGEQVTVTSITHTNFSFRSVGSAAHGNNASVTPGAPAGRAAGDLLVLLAAIRATSGTVTTPTGYTSPSEQPFTHFRIFLRIATNTAADLPTVAFSGGAAGDDTSAQIAAFSGPTLTDASKLKLAINGATSPSQQNINYYGAQVTKDNSLVIVAGWKQDDWTSVATLSGFTEIAEPSTTTGNDQGIVWDYVIQTTRTNISGSGNAFAVTGGASAVGKAITLVIQWDTQTATVTRSVNGVSKSQAAGAAIKIKDPFRFHKGEAVEL